jgi:hypothetical protein
MYDDVSYAPLLQYLNSGQPLVNMQPQDLNFGGMDFAGGNPANSPVAGNNPGAGGFNLGNLATGVNTASNLFGAWTGFKQLGLAKDSLKESKRQFNLNYDNQKTLTNSRLEDRQRARYASNPGQYESVGTYMNKNGIS